MYRTIIAGCNGRERGRGAVSLAHAISLATGARLLLVGVHAVGKPADELIVASESLDLLVLGSRRLGPVRRLALGSTSERVIRDAACPVLVPPLRIGAEHAEPQLAPLAVSAR